MVNKVMFGLERDNDGWRVWYMTSIRGGEWSYPRRISKPFSTKERAMRVIQYIVFCSGIKNWHVSFDCY